MVLGQGANVNGGVGNGRNNAQRGDDAPQPPRPRTASDFIQSTLMPAFLQAMANSNASGQNANNPSGTDGRSRRHSAGNDHPQQAQQNEGGGFLEQLLANLIPNNASIRIQFGNGGMNIGNINLGDFATDANFDEIVTQILNQFDPSANNQRISEEDLQHLPRSKVTNQQVENESQCTTCMDQFTLGEEVGELACHHIFHPDCIIPWLRQHNTCPICRASINPETENWRNQNPSNPLPPEQRDGFRDGDELD
jgi:hypothetical protein